MKIPGVISLALVAACVVISCIKPSQSSQKAPVPTVTTDAYATARDYKQHISTRMEAASHLTEDQKKQLQAELFKEIPGDLDIKTLNAIYLLGKIGDSVAAEKLDQFLHGPADMPGKIGAATEVAMTEIRKRNAN